MFYSNNTEVPKTPKAKKPKTTEAEAEKRIAKGTRVAVYWPREDTWFDGRIGDYRPHNRKHQVYYDDGDEDWVRLSTREVHFGIR